MYAPVLIGVLPTVDGNFTVYAVSDLYREINGILTLNVHDFDKNLLKSYLEQVLIPENGCIHLALDVNDFVKEFKKNEIYIEIQLVDNEDDSMLAERIQYLVYPKLLNPTYHRVLRVIRERYQ